MQAKTQRTRRMLRGTGYAMYAFVAAALSTGASAAFAQQGSMPGGGPIIQVEAPKVISIDFRGGSALDYVNEVKDAAEEINIVVKGPLEEITLPAIHLKQVSVSSALELLDKEMLDRPDKRILLTVDEIRGEAITQRNGNVILEHGRTPSIYVVTANVDVRDQSRVSRKTISRVWALTDVLKTIPADDLLSTIDVALPLATEGEPDVDIRFHEETGILIARGEPAALDMIEQTMSQLSRTAQLRQVDRDRERKLDALQSRLVELEDVKAMREASIQSMENEQRELRNRLMEMEQRIVMLQQELKVRDARIQQLEGENSLLRRELNSKDREQ